MTLERVSHQQEEKFPPAVRKYGDRWFEEAFNYDDSKQLSIKLALLNDTERSLFRYSVALRLVRYKIYDTKQKERIIVWGSQRTDNSLSEDEQTVHYLTERRKKIEEGSKGLIGDRATRISHTIDLAANSLIASLTFTNPDTDRDEISFEQETAVTQWANTWRGRIASVRTTGEWFARTRLD